jgi:hypothetical protein
LNTAKGATPFEIAEIMQETFNVTENEGLFNFNDCKTAVMFCNGMWCGQSPANIKDLLKLEGAARWRLSALPGSPCGSTKPEAEASNVQ